ncbi:MAG: radical SAM protein [Actinomycetota bacterium]
MDRRSKEPSLSAAPPVTSSPTTSLCPTCLRTLPAAHLERDGRVYLARTCPDHGRTEALVCSDAEWYAWSRKFIRPGRKPAFAATPSLQGCPYDCGFCPEHRQHGCVTVLEITEACNLECPACFAGEAHVRHASLEDVDVMVRALLRAEGGSADVVMLSGGEPTLHPRFLEIADRVASARVRYVIVNSNGVRVARDPGFARAIAERDMLVYLQFDGLTPDIYERLRGRAELLDVKLRALENLAAAGGRVVLVATVLADVNLNQVGELVRFGAQHPAVRAVSLQPEFGEGRFVPFDPADRVDVAAVIGAIDRDSGIFQRDDFIPIPCCDPICTAATYAYVQDGKVTPVSRLVPVEAYLDYVSNTAMPNLSRAFRQDADEMRDTLLKLFSKSNPAGSQGQAEAFACACGPLLSEMGAVEDLPEHIFAVTIEGFMDRFTFDVDRASRCCIQEALPDGRIVPFCVYNTLYRFAPNHRPQPRR